MNRLAAITIGIVLGFSAFASGNEEKVLLFIRYGTSTDIDFVVEQEANVMISMLEEAGFSVDVATDSREVIRSPNGKTLLRPDVRIADADVNDYVGIILPCMSKGSVRRSDPREIVAVLQAALAVGKPVAAQHASITFLREAGVPVGYGTIGAIRDGNVITNDSDPSAARYYGTEDTTRDLVELFIEAIRDQELR